MKIIDVIPIAKGIPQEKLSYFTSKDVSVGALVSVPVIKKNIPAIVSAVSDAKESKISLKDSSFTMEADQVGYFRQFYNTGIFGSLQRNSRVLSLYVRLRAQRFCSAGDIGRCLRVSNIKKCESNSQ